MAEKVASSKEAEVPAPLKEQKTVEISQWPSEPVDLRPHGFAAVILHAYDVFLCLVPIALMIKIGLVIKAHHDNQKNGAHGWRIDQTGAITIYLIRFNGQLVTLFTILFVTIVATLLRRYALYKAQRGAYVADLEQLQGSLSLPSTLKTALSLKAISLTTLGLICLWSFYYLGSQASKGEYVYRDSGKFYDFPVSVTGGIGHSQLVNETLGEDQKVYFYQQYIIANSARDTINGIDRRESALIPIIELRGDAPYKKNGWRDVSQASKSADIWSSVVGLYLLNNQGSPTILGGYKANSSYIFVNCTAPTLVGNNATTALANLTLDNTAITVPGLSASGNSSLSTPVTLDLWQAFDDTRVMTTHCQVYTSYVEVEVACVVKACRTKAMRYTPGHQGPTTDTILSNPVALRNLLDGLQLPGGLNSGSAAAPRLIDTAIPEPFNLYSQYAGDAPGTDDSLSSLFATEASTSITSIINTYYMQTLTSTGPSADTNAYLNGTAHDPLYQIVTVHGAIYDPQYAISIPWIVIDFISNVILLIAAILSYYLRTKTLAPDIFGYVSSLTRDNPHLSDESPGVGSTLSGLQRAKLMKSVKIRIGGLEQDGKNRVALVPAKQDGSSKGLSPNEQYL